MSARVAVLLVAAVCLSVSAAARTAEPKTISYGPEPTSFGELTLPSGNGRFPVAVLIHGGCWRSEFGSTESFRAMAQALAEQGVAAWNIEYRRVGHDGGGWPGTYRDLGKAVDLLDSIAKQHPLDLRRVVLVGHSSGGHFAAWLASRKLLPENSPIRGKPAVDVAGVVMADAFIDPRVIDSKGVDGKLYCGEPLLERLVGGNPVAHPDRLRQISPIDWLPWRVPQEYIISSRRYPVTPPRPLADGRTTMVMRDYPALARAAGDVVNVETVDDADHGSFTKEQTAAFSAVQRAVLRLLKATDERVNK